MKHPPKHHHDSKEEVTSLGPVQTAASVKAQDRLICLDEDEMVHPPLRSRQKLLQTLDSEAEDLLLSQEETEKQELARLHEEKNAWISLEVDLKSRISNGSPGKMGSLRQRLSCVRGIIALLLRRIGGR